MSISYSLTDLGMYLFLYSFLGWAVEVCCIAIRDRHFVNRGFFNLPLNFSYGATAVILLITLPPLDHKILLQYLLTLVFFVAVRNISNQLVRGLSRKKEATASQSRDIASKKDLPFAMIAAAAFLLMYLIVHPIIFALVTLMPELLILVLDIVLSVLSVIDFASVLYALRTSTVSKGTERTKANTQRLADRMSNAIWNRLQKAYPGIQNAEEAEQERYVFAKGICFDKLVWVFVATSFLGALIEMCFCRVTGGVWMSRSGVLYGAFSFVWGFGAVVLTVVLQRFAGKEDRKIFVAGFLIGGAYEYLCSVFTELVFGTVFWDYSDMPLNIGGRTNVLFCIFWGLLAVVWIKVLYPPMDKCIEKLPALLGKILTWIVVFLLACDAVLTSCAMLRYTERQTQPQPGNVIEEFLDERYDDAWMEHRWPNMIIADEADG